MTPLLDVAGLAINLQGHGAPRALVRDVSFAVAPGEALGIVGESGSGKSMSMLALLRLLPRGVQANFGAMRFGGQDVAAWPISAFAPLRGREIAMVFQDPMAALNPVLTIGRQIGEVLRRHFRMGRFQATERAAALLARVGISDPALRVRQYPHELSGGMRQRTMIAIALAGEPRLLIADEPTTALDVTVQADIVALIQDLQQERGMAVVWVTHDLALLARIAERVIVMQAGRIVEAAPVEELFARPRHPCTRALLRAAGA